MKYASRTFLIILFGLTALSISAWRFQDRKQLLARVDRTVKDVLFRNSSTKAWIKATSNTELLSGSDLITKDSSFAMIKFTNGSRIAVRPHTHLTMIEEHSGSKTPGVGVFLQYGRAVFNIALNDSDQFLVKSPFSIASIRGPECSFSCEASTKQASLSIGTGVAEVWCMQDDSRHIIHAGQTATIDSTGCTIK